MKLSELIAAVGDGNIHVQYMSESSMGVDLNRRDARVSFYTGRQFVSDYVHNAILNNGKPSEFVGVVLWIPSKLIPNEKKD